MRAIDHGTAGGYEAHRRRGIPACNACLRAQATYLVSKVYERNRTIVRQALEGPITKEQADVLLKMINMREAEALRRATKTEEPELVTRKAIGTAEVRKMQKILRSGAKLAAEVLGS